MKNEDIEIELSAFCGDLLSYSNYEWFVKRILQFTYGTWHRVSDLFKINGPKDELVIPHRDTLFVVCLKDPEDDNGFCFILFYDLETGWSMTASYNRERLDSFIS